ncbi:bifunctional helix-turn-helix domain-containing protein/methylated-DNA--[protein]-cysteine S-methyltransferase [Planctobacterium marinum]|uniref:bifunctional helix-turn-helix domain-containing protein/methylated-DNA--[protein]-cysteine S-methyltransferase n=1 Tax=Planctobacterium marinum TaxID=1631968 RepID=UPI001E330543|nr:methylated-DNA--[protein]-cysteine S-methyltransferase [Planctobacterium marinum]MCC2605074.1 methylated-DNA--[protein]-cysteine S-methyltransferase [Planctobacterium marinum]
MLEQKQIDYERIENAIHFIRENFKEQPSLALIANAVNLSPFHFQRMFSEWVGVSPKKFMQYISLDYAKTLLNNRITLLDAAYETGLSGSSRLHDLFVNIEAMTPGEFKNGGANLILNYCFAISPFGKVLVASTPKGVCHMSFEENEEIALSELNVRFPNAELHQINDKFQQDALLIFQKDWRQMAQIKLHLAGTPFQLKVWESLLKIPMGKLCSYSDIARNLSKPKASRAVGSAIGNNPVAFLIPCHRVIQSGGQIGGYKWGSNKKTAIIGWEAARTAQSND